MDQNSIGPVKNLNLIRNICSTRFPNLTTAGERRQEASRSSRGPTILCQWTCGHRIPSARRGNQNKNKPTKTEIETLTGDLGTPKQSIAEIIKGELLTETGNPKGGKSEVPLLKQSGAHWPSTPPLNCTALDYIGFLKVRRNTLNTRRINIGMPTVTLENSQKTPTSRTNQLKELRL